MQSNCRICNSNNLDSVDSVLTNFEYFVTSDCNISQFKPHILLCPDCGFIQKHVTDEFITQTENLYENYQIYNQGNQEEQLIFSIDGKPKARTDILFEKLIEHIDIGDTGTLAEVGCGYGKFLSAFNSQFPHWSLYGYDLGSQYDPVVNAISNAQYIQKEFGKTDDKLDLIVGIHLLEHLYDPLSFLHLCRENLAEEGKIFLQVPNIRTSTFDLIIADHVSHFSVDHFKQLAKAASLTVELVSEDIISKELFCILSKRPQTQDDTPENRRNTPHPQVQKNIDFVKSFEQLTRQINEPVKIFGSSIGASWLSQYVPEHLTCFIDEDPSRIGQFHLNTAIESTSQISTNDNLLLPVSSEVAFAIKKRLSDRDANFIHPDLKK